MKKALITIDPSKSGYWGTVEDLYCTVSFGKSISDLEANLRDAIELSLDVLKEDGAEIPDIFAGEYDFEYQLRIESFFDLFPQIKQSAVGAYAEINSSLLRQYARNLKQPGPNQLKKIEEAIHQLGRELQRVKLV